MTQRVLVISPHLRQDGAIGALRVDHVVYALRAGGWDVTALGRHVGSHRDDAVVSDPAWEMRRWIEKHASNGVWGRAISALLFRAIPDEQVFWSVRVARHRPAQPYDVIVVTGPPFSVFLGAALLSRRSNTPLVLDYRDLWTLGGYFDRIGWRAWLERQLERWVWRRARAAITVSEPLVRELRAVSRIPRCEVVKNGYDPRLYEGFQYDVRTSKDEPLSIAHLGEIYPGRRDPEPLFRALSSDPDLRRSVRLNFYGSNAHTLLRMVEKWGLQDCVSLRERVPLDEALAIQQRTDALLLLLWNDPKEVGVYSGKLFEYMASRRRVLMLGYEEGVAAELLRERNGGVVANDPEVLRETLHSWVVEKRSGAWRPTDGNAATGLDRDTQVEYLKPIIAWAAN